MSLSVCTPLASKVPPLRGVGLIPWCWLQSRPLTLNPPILNFVREIVMLAKLLWVIVDRMYGRLLVNTNLPSWSYGNPVVLELSYYICDDKDEPFVSNCTFK